MKSIFAFAAFAAVTAFAATGHASNLCGKDKLTATEAHARNLWMHKCIDEAGGRFHNFTHRQISLLETQPTEDSAFPEPRLKPMYVTFVSEADVTVQWFAPADETASCETPEGFKIIGICESK